MPGWMKWAVSLILGFAVILLGWKLADNRWLYWVLPAFFVVNCLFLIIVVLLQSGKAADIAGAFGGAGSQTAFGPRGAATILSRATTWCAIMFMICAMALVLHTDKAVGQGGSSVLQNLPKPAPQKAPAASTPVPVAPAPQPSSAPASQTPAPATQAPAAQAPAPSQPAPAPPKKP